MAVRMSPRERKIEAALIDWFRREGWEIDAATHHADNVETDYRIIDLVGLAHHIADEIER